MKESQVLIVTKILKFLYFELSSLCDCFWTFRDCTLDTYTYSFQKQKIQFLVMEHKDKGVSFYKKKTVLLRRWGVLI